MECLLIAAGAGDTAEHLIRLALLAGALQQAGSPPQDVENVPVLTLQAHGGLSLLRIFQVIPAQLIGNVVTQPGASELSMGLQAPHGQLPHIQLDAVKGEQQVGQLLMLKHRDTFKPAAIQQDARLRQKVVDPVHPLLEVAAAALEDQALLSIHAPQVFCRNSLDLCHGRLLSGPPPLGPGLCSSQLLLVRHDRDAQLLCVVDLRPHSLGPGRAVHVDLLASLHQAQAHVPRRLVLDRIVRVGKGRKYEVGAYRHIP